MSVQVANINLAAAVVGTSGQIALGSIVPPPTIQQQMQGQYATNATLLIFNESGCGLTCTFPDTGETFTLAAGAWKQVYVHPNESRLTYTVIYVLPNAPVSLLLADLYVPGEAVDHIGVLGNSPIGLSGNVSANVQQIVNDNHGPGTSIIEATPNDQVSSSWAVNNDASGFIQVLSANVLRKILNVVRGNSGVVKATIELGDAGDTSITTLHGAALNVGDGGSGGYMTAVDTATNTDLQPTQNRMVSLSMRDGGGIVRSILRTSASGATTFLDSTGVQLAGKATVYNGSATAGLGLSPIMAQALSTAVTVTTQQTIISAALAAGTYEISGYVIVNNGTQPSTVNIVYSFTDASFSEVVHPIATTGSNVISIANASINNGAIMLVTHTIQIASGSLAITYQDSTGTPNDKVTFIVKRLA